MSLKKCLLVDDSKVVRKLALRIIEPMNLFTFEEAEHGKDAVEKCTANMPDFILLDWYMPEMNGLEFLKHLRAMPNGTHPIVIFCTTENDYTKIMEAVSAGANEFVMKPFDEEIIRTKLQQVGLLQ